MMILLKNLTIDSEAPSLRICNNRSSSLSRWLGENFALSKQAVEWEAAMEPPGDAAGRRPRCRRGSDGSEGDAALSEDAEMACH